MKLFNLLYDLKIKTKNIFEKMFKKTKKDKDTLKRVTLFLDYAFTNGVIPITFDEWYDMCYLLFETPKDKDVVNGHLKYQSITNVRITNSSTSKIILYDMAGDLMLHLKATYMPTQMDLVLLEEMKIIESLQNYYKQFKDLQLLVNYSGTNEFSIKHTKKTLKSNINIFYKNNLAFFASKTFYPLFTKTGIILEKTPEYYTISHLKYTYKGEKIVYNFLVYDMKSLKEKCFFIWNVIEEFEMEELNKLKESLNDDYLDGIKDYFITIIKALFVLQNVDIVELKYVPFSKIVFLVVDMPIEVENFIKNNFENMDMAVVVKMKAIISDGYHFIKTRKYINKESRC